MARATNAAGQRLFIKVFNDARCGRHEIMIHSLILYAEQLHNQRQDSRRHGRLDGRITKVIWTGECDGYPVLVMKAEQEAERPIATPIQLAKFAQEVATTLAILHDDVTIAHGDIKPYNLVVTKNDGDKQPIRVVICDFGSADTVYDDALPDAPMHRTGGTKGYSAPESDGYCTSPESDVYSLGATLRQVMRYIKCKSMRALIARMMDSIPENRPHARDVVEGAKAIQMELETTRKRADAADKTGHPLCGDNYMRLLPFQRKAVCLAITFAVAADGAHIVYWLLNKAGATVWVQPARIWQHRFA
ncbi:kinase-like domain-containing protein [Thamnocephalis sphaerospora]|uniref:Kinase-like domain-containing protein n=1 Tax=Thamnocephalis sphaerospora TaxID=78915 RepID=A0A4P9XGX6_9FUNG|nr:kinase-like domain-containing protein [Thamnocephalis sphaerospora]|eukprot:RKP04904.1 kinase-like domain-containing protein [Thamnocephalis sphaerospora]